MENIRVNTATGALVVLRSTDLGVNAQVPINQPILNFPASPAEVSQMTGILSFPRFLFLQAGLIN